MHIRQLEAAVVYAAVLRLSFVLLSDNMKPNRVTDRELWEEVLAWLSSQGVKTMLSPFYSAVKQNIEPIIKPLGFRSYRRYYYRIINDVVQQFFPLWLHHDFTIRFVLRSLYQDNERTAEGDEVMRLINGTNLWLGPTSTEIAPHHYVANENFLTLTPKTYQLSADICKEALTEYLLPWFEENTDSAKAYAACKTAKLYLSPQGCTEPLGGLGFLLGMGEWDRACAALYPYIEHTIRFNPRWWSTVESEYTSLYRALIGKDAPYIRHYMEEKRQKNYKEFKWKDSP
ncbi:MAG: hypothetical protein PUG87_12420 [Eubacteriales bacterium]|nr:hypothetical protein [Eubacteriales bacterium]